MALPVCVIYDDGEESQYFIVPHAIFEKHRRLFEKLVDFPESAAACYRIKDLVEGAEEDIEECECELSRMESDDHVKPREITQQKAIVEMMKERQAEHEEWTKVSEHEHFDRSPSVVKFGACSEIFIAQSPQIKDYELRPDLADEL